MVQTIEQYKRRESDLLHLMIPVGVKPVVTRSQFQSIAAANRDLRLELTANGELVIMPPAGSASGNRNAGLTGQMYVWYLEYSRLGEIFDSSAGFTLPSGAIRSPDASWIRKERWDALEEADQQGFAHICPDVVVELRSATDSLSALQDKMSEYVENGIRFGLLIDLKRKAVEIYRQNRKVEVIENPDKVSFDEAMPRFNLRMSGLW